MTESQWLAERNNLQAQVDALEAARLQYKASMERFEKLGRACDTLALHTEYPFAMEHVVLAAWVNGWREGYAEWKAGEPKEAKEAT